MLSFGYHKRIPQQINNESFFTQLLLSALEMKLKHKRIDYHTNSGEVGLVAENGEDMWHTFNLLQPGDTLRASAIRKVQHESKTGTVSSSRVRTTLTVSVETIDFDYEACTLHVKGRTVEKNNHVPMGSYHTLDLEVERKFTLFKKHWDSVFMDRIKLACDPGRTADLAAVVMDEGLAHVCLVMSSMTLVKAKIEVQIPRKRRGHSTQHDKGVHRFFDQVVQAIERHIDFSVVKCVILASPGFVKDQFSEYMHAQAVRSQNKTLMENKGKFVAVHSSSGFIHSLKEALTDESIASRVADTRALDEIRSLDTFYEMLQNDPERACYGLNHVIKANRAEAIQVLMVTDDLVRANGVEQRRLLVRMIDSVKKARGQVRMFSALHTSGEQLKQMTGIAAILRFAVPGIDDSDGDDSSDSD